MTSDRTWSNSAGVSSRTWTRSSGWSGAGAGRKRNRRLAAGGLALLVAVGGSLAAYAALRDDGDRLPGISDGSSPAALPTALLLTCDGETTTGGYVQVEVVDPEGVFVPTELPCGDVTGWFYDYAPDAEGDPDPVASAREQEWVEPGDIVEPAGYPESETRLVRVVRDGEIVAVLEYFRNGPDEWLETSGNACEGVVL